MKKFSAFLLLTCFLSWGVNTRSLAQQFVASDYFANLNFNDEDVFSNPSLYGEILLAPHWEISHKMTNIVPDPYANGVANPSVQQWDVYTGNGSGFWLGGSPAGDGSYWVYLAGNPFHDDNPDDIGWKIFSQSSNHKVPAGYYTITVTYGCDSSNAWSAHSNPTQCSGTPSLALYAEDASYNVYEETPLQWTGNSYENLQWHDPGSWIPSIYDYSYARTATVHIDLQHEAFLELGIVTYNASNDFTYAVIDNFTVEATLYSDHTPDTSFSPTDYFLNMNLDDGSAASGPSSWTTYSGATHPIYQWEWLSTADDASHISPLMSGQYMRGDINSNLSTLVPAGTKLFSQVSTNQLPAGTYKLSLLAHTSVQENVSETDHSLFALYAAVRPDQSLIPSPISLPDDNLVYHSLEESQGYEAAEYNNLYFTVPSDGAYVEIGLITSYAFTPSELSLPRLYFDDFSLEQAYEVIAITSAEYATYYSSHEYHLPGGLVASTIKDISSPTAGSSVGHLSLPWEFDATAFPEGDTHTGIIIPASTALLVSGPEGTHYGLIEAIAPVYSSPDVNQLHYENILFGSMTETLTYVPENSILFSPQESYYYYQFSYGPIGSDYASQLGFYWRVDAGGDGSPFTSLAQRCWMALPQSEVTYGQTPIRGFVISSPDDTSTPTSITSVDTTSHPTPAQGIYTLQGTRVKDMNHKGVYIVDGHKLLVK